MPKLPRLTPRLQTLKPQLQVTKSGGWTSDRVRGSRHERGYGSVWEKTRARILARDKGLCQVCLQEGRVSLATQVDHIVNKAYARQLGWTDEQIEADSNLQSICLSCHKAKSQRESRGNY